MHLYMWQILCLWLCAVERLLLAVEQLRTMCATHSTVVGFATCCASVCVQPELRG